jgi:NADH:ubiquinone oxidoreductase subunit 6 (subunit J)
MPHVLPLDVATTLASAHLWPIALTVLLGGVAIYLLLPRPRAYPPLWGAAIGALALLLAGWMVIRHAGFHPDTVLFYAFSGIAIVAGVLLISQRNPARAALSFALVVLSTCGLFLLQAAPFLMAATIIIYAGAIIVTFLFVLMLAQQEGVSDADFRSREPLLSTVAGFVLLGALLYVLVFNYDTRRLDALIARIDQARNQDSVQAIDDTLAGGAADGGRQGGDGFFVQLLTEIRQLPGAPEKSNLEGKVKDLQLESWPELKEQQNVPGMKQALANLSTAVQAVRDTCGSLRMPSVARASYTVPPAHTWENVAPLGRALFTDYLLAVELGGTLLLVAAVGAIAIANRRGEGLR